MNKSNETNYSAPYAKVVDVELEGAILSDSNVEQMKVNNTDWD